ncbi:MAG: methyltransferase [Pseudomonadota bacterium]
METTQDGFLDNAFQVVQPAKGGHRAGLDALLLAASVGPGAKGVLADFGSGAGVAGLAALHHASGLSAVLIERDTDMAGLTKQSLGLNPSLQPRARVLNADLTVRGSKRLAAGLSDNCFDWVIANPPFNGHQAHQPSPHALKKSAHQMHENLLSQWVETARLTLRHKGELRFILRPQNLTAMLTALDGFGNCRILPIAPHAGKNAHRIIVAAKRGRSDPLQILPPLVLHKSTGGFTAEAETIMRGKNLASIMPPA